MGRPCPVLCLIALMTACLCLASCGPEHSEEARQAREQIVKYCSALPHQTPERCQCIVDRLQHELSEEDFQDLAQALDGMNSAQSPSAMLDAMGDMLHALSGAGQELERAFSEADRACRGGDT